MHIKHKKFLLLFVIATSTLLSLVALFNYIVDPMKVYSKSNATESDLEHFANAVINSESGVLLEGTGERALKMALSTQAGAYDCVIMGSSPIVPISEIVMPNIIPQCNNKLLNLGVSLCGMEDVFIYSYQVLKGNNKPKKVFIAVVDGLFLPNTNQNYIRYEKTYKQMLHLLEEGEAQETSPVKYYFKLAKNLINIEYFYKSIDYCKNNDNKDNKDMPWYDKLGVSVTYVSRFDYRAGGEKNVILNDGSLIYTKKFVERERPKKAYVDAEVYEKINTRQKDDISIYTQDEIQKVYTEKGGELLRKLINIYRKNNIEVNFVIAPRLLMSNPDPSYIRHISLLDTVMRWFAKENDINVYGSYFSHEIGCENLEYFDGVHPRIECLEKIFKVE